MKSEVKEMPRFVTGGTGVNGLNGPVREFSQLVRFYKEQVRLKQPHFHTPSASINFEEDVPNGKVGRRTEGASLLGVSGGMTVPPPPCPVKILKVRCLEMPYSTFSRQYLALKNDQN